MVLPPSEVKDGAGVKGLKRGHIQRSSWEALPDRCRDNRSCEDRADMCSQVTAHNTGLMDAVECAVGRLSHSGDSQCGCKHPLP